MPRQAAARVVAELTARGYNADRAAVTLLVGADDTDRALDRVVESVPEDALKVTADDVRAALDADASGGTGADASGGTGPGDDEGPRAAGTGAAAGGDPSVSTGDGGGRPTDGEGAVPVETEGSPGAGAGTGPGTGPAPDSGPDRAGDRPPAGERLSVSKDVTGRSTGTGEYDDFVSVFRDRFERLSGTLRSRVTPRPVEAVEAMSGGAEADLVGMVEDVRSTASGHHLIELEDATGTFPCLVMKDRSFVDDVRRLLLDEVVAVEGTLADDGGILFVDDLHFPDVPRGHSPSTADRHVRAALVSDVHVGSHEFRADAWEAFADWLHTEEAAAVEYLLIAGDMVEGVGVYPGQDEELSIVDVYEQYERFSEHLKSVPGDLEVVMVPGNHDAVRLAEPQPAFDEELRSIMSAHDARIVGNPALVTVEGVSVLMYHGVSLDEVIAEFPGEVNYEHPHRAMNALLRKRHLAPQFGGEMRIAPEQRDYLVIDEVPDVFHTGHVHKLGYGTYRNVLSINSGCWQAQTDFQRRVDIDPDVARAPIVDLDDLSLTIRRFD